MGRLPEDVAKLLGAGAVQLFTPMLLRTEKLGQLRTPLAF